MRVGHEWLCINFCTKTQNGPANTTLNIFIIGMYVRVCIQIRTKFKFIGVIKFDNTEQIFLFILSFFTNDETGLQVILINKSLSFLNI